MLTLLLLCTGVLSAHAKVIEEKTLATLQSPTGITWDGTNKTFSWSSQYGNQLHNIGLPNGDISGYEKLVVDCDIQEGDGYRIMFYADGHGTNAGGISIITESGKKEFLLKDFNMDADYLKKCSEICLSGYNGGGKVKVNSVYLTKPVKVVYATFASPTGITWDGTNKTFSWSSQYGNQLHNIGLPNGDISGYEKLVVDCDIQEGDGYRIMFYADGHGTNAGGISIITESGKKEFLLKDFNMDADYLKKCSEICLSGYNGGGKVKVNSVYLTKPVKVVYATFASPTGITWDGTNKTFSWSSQYGNQLHNIGLPNGDISGYEKVVVDCEILEGDSYRIMFYANNKGTTAGGTTVINSSGVKEFLLKDFAMDADYLKDNSEFCLSGNGGSGKVKVNSVYFVMPADPLAPFKAALQTEIDNATEINTTNPNTNLANIIADAQTTLANPAATEQDLTDAQELLKAASALKSSIDKANETNPVAYSEESFTNLQNAALTADGELADAAATKASLEAAQKALQKVVDALVLKNGFTDLTKADYNDGTCDYNLDKSVDMVYGQAGVDKGKYANLIDYDRLIVTVTEGAPRFCFNRETADGADADNEADSKMIDIPTKAWGSLRYLTVSADKKVYTIDLQKMGVEKGKVLLHAIKGADGANVTVTGIYKVNTSNIDVQQQSIGRLKGNDLYPDAGALSMPLTNEDNMILNPTKESKEDIRLWENENGTVELQIKKGSTFFIQTASEGKTVYKIKFVGDNIKLVCSNGTFEVPEKPNYKTVVWDGDIDAVKFWAVEDMKLTLVRVYSRPSDTNTDLYEKNDDEVAKAVVDALKRTLKEANATDLKDMTDESVEAFNEALAGARMQEEMKTSIVDIEAARLALKDAIAGLKEKPASGEIIVDLDGSLYHNWSEVSGTAEDKGAVPGGGVILDEEVAIGGSIWGNLSGAVPYLDYANITDFTEMRIEGTPGATIRIMCNRTTDEGPIYEIKPTFDADGKITVKISDLKFLNGGTPCDFVCLQSIKVPASWAGGTMAATIKSIKLVKIVPVDIVEDFDASFYHNWSEVSGTAEDKGVVAGGGVKLGEEVAIGGSIWGNLSGAVPYLDYANITDFTEMRIEGTPGATIRIMCNRTTDEGPIYEIKPTFDADGKITVKISDLKFLNGGTPCDFVCLQSIKVPASWAGGTMPATITSIKIVKKSGVEPEPTPEPAKNDLTKEIFKKWSGIDAEATSESTGCDLVLNTEVGPGSIVYGNASVSYLTYANLKGYKELVINGTPGMQLRVLFNRQEVDGDDPNGGALTELNPTIGEDGKAVIDLLDAALNGAARLNAIKTGWGSPAGTITGFELVEGGSVGVVNVKANNKPQRIYNLGGQLLNKPVKGINIIDGKKVYIP